MFTRFSILVLACVMIFSACNKQEGDTISEDVKKMEADYKVFYDSITGQISAAYTNQALAYFEASIKSNKENWTKFMLTMLQ